MIKIKDVSKLYKIYESRSNRLKEWLSGRKLHNEFWALKNINLEVPKGTAYGIIGMNGAGKSTLLKIITGTTRQTTGSVDMQGRVAALLELGTGFHPELTGRQNVKLNGKLHGLSDDEIEAKMGEIQNFSELADFFDEPVRTYSSGMYVRLAFALSVSIDPDILIIDEALSVGDAYFQQKCIDKLKSFRSKGVTILFVSHDPGVVKTLCDHAALLDKGKLISTGSPSDCLDLYNALLAKKEGHGTEYVIDKQGASMVSGNRKAEITKVEIQDLQGKRLEAFVAGDRVHIALDVSFNEPISNPTVGILIRDRLGYDVFGTNTAQLFRKTGTFAAKAKTRFIFDCSMNLGPGAYTITAAIHSSTTHIEECYQWVDRVLTFQVLPRSDFNFLGVSMLRPELQIHDLG